MQVPARQGRVFAPLALCFAVLAFLALQVLLQGPITRVDHTVTGVLAAHRQPWLTGAMLFLADAHETLKVLAATILLALWRTWRRDLRDVRFLAVVPAGMGLNVMLKHLFARPRPDQFEPLVQLTTFSFPSGHAVASTVFYGALCTLVFAHTRSPVLRALAVAVAVAMVLLVTFSRVYLGAHYFSDVVAGVAEGMLCLLLFWRYVRR